MSPMTAKIRAASRQRVQLVADDAGKRLRGKARVLRAEEVGTVGRAVRGVVSGPMYVAGLRLSAPSDPRARQQLDRLQAGGEGNGMPARAPKAGRDPSPPAGPKKPKVAAPRVVEVPPPAPPASKPAKEPKAQKPPKAPKPAEPTGERAPASPEPKPDEPVTELPADMEIAVFNAPPSGGLGRRRAEPLPAPGRPATEVEHLKEEIARVAARDDYVFVGPFLTELGFELLYWIPLLRWALEEFPSLRERLIVLSRGGTHHWYHDMFVGYVDAFALADRDEYLRRRPSLKQRDVTAFELELYERARRRLGIDRADALHPSLSFNSYYRAMKIDRHTYPRHVEPTSDGALRGHGARYELMPRPALGKLDGRLPDEFVAARFYFRPSLPDVPENRAFAGELIASLAAQGDVVLLNNRMELDDHSDLDLAGHERVHVLSDLMDEGDNIHVQTVAVSRAKAFVGTYGGLAYLPPFLGVPSITFSSSPEHTHPWHLHLAQRLCAHEGWGSLVTLETRDLQTVGLLTEPLRRHRDEESVR